MKKRINNGTRTVAGIHEQLVGKEIVIDGREVTISDTTETDSEQVFFGVKAKAIDALYLEGKWIKYAGQ